LIIEKLPPVVLKILRSGYAYVEEV